MINWKMKMIYGWVLIRDWNVLTSPCGLKLSDTVYIYVKTEENNDD